MHKKAREIPRATCWVTKITHAWGRSCDIYMVLGKKKARNREGEKEKEKQKQKKNKRIKKI
jgi:hypothetical protein